MNVCLDCGTVVFGGDCSRCGGNYCVPVGDNPKRQYERANSGTLTVLPAERERVDLFLDEEGRL